MIQNLDMTEIEQKVYRDFHQDGLLDVIGGICLIGGACNLYTGNVLFALLPFALFPVYRAMKRRLTYPRIGYAKLVDEKPTEVVPGILIYCVILLACMALLLAFFGDIRDINHWVKWMPLFFGVVFVGMFHFLATKSGSARYRGFAVFSVALGLLLSLVSFSWDKAGVFLYFAVIGFSLLLFGLFFCVRFVRQHPIVLEEVSNGHE